MAGSIRTPQGTILLTAGQEEKMSVTSVLLANFRATILAQEGMQFLSCSARVTREHHRASRSVARLDVPLLTP